MASDATKSDALQRRTSDAIAKGEEGTAWRGDDHQIAVSAAKEVGLEGVDAELESFTAGFRAGMDVESPEDRAIVVRGRTVLKEKQLLKALDPTLRFLRIPPTEMALRVHDGEFELRVGRAVADKEKPVLDSAKVALQVWIAAGLVGLFVMQWSNPGAAIIWGLGLIFGGWTMRQGLVNGRSMMAARLTVALAMLSREEGLILPPVGKTGALAKAGALESEGTAAARAEVTGRSKP